MELNSPFARWLSRESLGSVFNGVSFSFRKLHSGPFWTVPGLLFESNRLIPALVRLLWQWHYYSCACRTFSSALLSQGQALLMINSLRAFMIDHQTLSFQHNMEPGTTKPFPLTGQLAKPLSHGSIIIRFRLVTIHLGRYTDQLARFPFAQPMAFPGIGDR